MEIIKIILELIFSLAVTFPKVTCILVALIVIRWRIAYVNKNSGETKMFSFETTQTKDELKARASSALEKSSGEKVTSKKCKKWISSGVR